MNHARCTPHHPHRRVLVALAGLLWLGLAQAYTDPGMAASLNGRTVVMPATSYAQSWSTSVDGSGVKLGRNFTIPAPGGRSATAAVTSRLTGPLVLGIGARALATAAPWIAAGVAVYDVYNAVRVHPDGNGGLLLDPGQPPVTGSGLLWLCSGGRGETGEGSSPGAACAKYAAGAQPKSGPSGESYGYVSAATEAAGTLTVTIGCPSGPPPVGGWQNCPFSLTERLSVWSVRVNNVTQCPAVVDPFDPAYSSAGGAVGPDGKCPSGRGSAQPIDPEQAAAHAAAVDRLPEVYKQIMDEILDRQPVAIPKGAQTKVEEVTPSSIQGPITTTTGPDGVQETATGWDFGRISQDLANDFNAGRWNETTKKTTTKPDGTKTEETTKEEGTTPQEEALKEGDPCKVDPGRLGCIGLGEAPNIDIPKTSREVSYAPVSISTASGCPAPVRISGGGYFDYQPLCDGLTKARPLVILIGALMAAGIIAAALKA